MVDALLRVEGITKEYGTRVRTRALVGVDFALNPGEFVALVGPSGCGKSTLLNIIGLLDRPTSGRIVIAGTDTAKKTDDELTKLRAKTLGFVFQFHHLLPAFTALENVMLPAWGDEGFSNDTMRKDANALLRAVGLEKRASYRTTALSGGEQQRVAIARALSRKPLLVLADEPTGNLDTESATEVLELMKKVSRDNGTAFLVVTHDKSIAARCDRVIEMVDGRVRSDTDTKS